jgi:hypothetical protein
MARKIPSEHAPATAHPSVWLTHAARARYENEPAEDPLPAAHARHALLRGGVRRRKPLTALVNYGMTYSALLPVRDLSLTDVFVEMDPAFLSVGASLEFVLRYRYRGRPVELRLSGVVRRIEPDGVALRFGEYDDAAYTHLVNLLYAT